MQVFKLYFKIFRRSMLVPASIYVIIFMTLTVIANQTSGKTNAIQTGEFHPEKSKVLIIDKDQSVLSQHLTTYLYANSSKTELKDLSEKAIADALFFRKVEYVLEIPKGFETSVVEGKPLKLAAQQVPDSASGKLLENKANKYIRVFGLFLAADQSTAGSGGEDISKAAKKVDDTLDQEAKVTFLKSDTEKEIPNFVFYYNYLAYPLVAVFMLVVSWFIMTIREKDLQKRNACSPIDSFRFYLQVVLGTACFAVLVYLLFYGYALLNYRSVVFSMKGWLVALNAFVYTLLCLGIAFFISNLGSKKSIPAISNVVSLGLCFMGGVFVPQQFLSDGLLRVGVINPIFWYVKANNTIGNATVLSEKILRSFAFDLAVQVAFAVAFIVVSLLIIKQRSTEK